MAARMNDTVHIQIQTIDLRIVFSNPFFGIDLHHIFLTLRSAQI